MYFTFNIWLSVFIDWLIYKKGYWSEYDPLFSFTIFCFIFTIFIHWKFIYTFIVTIHRENRIDFFLYWDLVGRFRWIHRHQKASFANWLMILLYVVNLTIATNRIWNNSFFSINLHVNQQVFPKIFISGHMVQQIHLCRNRESFGRPFHIL